MAGARLPGLLVLPFQHIAAPDRDRFTFRLLAPWLFRGPAKPSEATDATPNLASAFRGLTSVTGLAVTWAGIQHERVVPVPGNSTKHRRSPWT